MKTVALFALFCCALSPLDGTAANVDAWTLWERDLDRACPSHHVERVLDGGYDDLLRAFEKTLPDKTRMSAGQLRAGHRPISRGARGATIADG